MFVLLLMVLNVLMLFFTFSSFSDKKRIFVFLAESISVFLCLYSLAAAVMWVFEAFSVEYCVLAVTVVVTAVFAFTYFRSVKKGKKGKEFFSFGGITLDHSVIFNRTAIVIATLLSLGAYSTIGIGYNDGNAQAQAISILNGQNSLEFEIDEYENIAQDSPYEYYFFDSVSNIKREDFTASYRIDRDYSLEGKQEIMIGQYGSNPVYPSLLALSGSMFGMQRMAYIQAIFAFCLFVFADEILRALKCNWKLRSVLVLLLGVSPIVVYSNHTTLVEPLIGFCMVMFTYFLLCKKDKLQILSSLGVITFAFLHTSVFTMIPLFMILYWMYFIHTRKVRHLVSSGIMIVGYILSFLFLNITAYENTSINYRIAIPFFGKKYYIFVIILFAVALIIGLILAIVLKKADSDKLREFEKGIGSRIFKILMAAAAIIPIPMTVILIILKCYTFQDFLSITFISFVVCSGVLMIPYVLFRLVTGKYHIGIKEATVVISFIYSVVLYSCVMKPMLEGYYYDSRYITSFIPFVIIISGMMLNLLKQEEKYVLPLIGIIIMLTPYTTSLLDSKAETRLDKNIFEDVMQIVEEEADEETVVFVEKGLLKYFYYPLIVSTDAKVYPIEPGYFDMFCDNTGDYFSNVLYITDGNGNNYSTRGTVCYVNYNYSYVADTEQSSVILGLPNRFSKGYLEKIQIIKSDAIHRFLNYEMYEPLEVEDIKLSIEKVEITDTNTAIVTVSVIDDDKIYYNDRLFLSYHLEYENEEDIYDLPRTLIGPLTVENFRVGINLNDQPEDVMVVIDIVEEGVAWYSWSNKVPVILFNKTDDGWDYKTYTLSNPAR